VRRVCVIVAATALSLSTLVLSAGCGESHQTNAVTNKGIPNAVFAVTKGMTKEQVRELAGKPYRSNRNCWLYHATKAGTNVDGRRFCFTNSRVSLVQTAQHG
jgi:outer membrane protein assembly factor BamE (lipoprotein component of BamABCDE complex)